MALVTCRCCPPAPYSLHLPQNLGDGVGGGGFTVITGPDFFVPSFLCLTIRPRPSSKSGMNSSALSALIRGNPRLPLLQSSQVSDSSTACRKKHCVHRVF